jgi:hypothetical protein
MVRASSKREHTVHYKVVAVSKSAAENKTVRNEATLMIRYTCAGAVVLTRASHLAHPGRCAAELFTQQDTAFKKPWHAELNAARSDRSSCAVGDLGSDNDESSEIPSVRQEDMVECIDHRL